jgi:sulfhydrogenase subunit gamma (sulfur reductase)
VRKLITPELLNKPAVNPFIPMVGTLSAVTNLTYDIKLFNIRIDDPSVRERFDYRPGQFGFVSAFGVGEAPFGISSMAAENRGVEFAIRRVGTVSNALHRLKAGDKVGIRGPHGNYFPLGDYRGKDIVIIGGGIGMAPLRPVINTIIQDRESYGDLLIINGARSPDDLVFTSEFDKWAGAPRTRLVLTVDRGDKNWPGRVALIPAVIKELAPKAAQAVTIICGPPIMIKFTITELKALGFSNGQIVTTLEGKMNCGMGKCCRCNVGEKYVCKDGPVFTYEQISHFIEQF